MLKNATICWLLHAVTPTANSFILDEIGQVFWQTCCTCFACVGFHWPLFIINSLMCPNTYLNINLSTKTLFVSVTMATSQSAYSNLIKTMS